jgi:hypothetical protein
MHARFWWGNLKDTKCFKGLGVDGKMVLKCVLKMYGGRVWTVFIWLGVTRRAVISKIMNNTWEILD